MSVDAGRGSRDPGFDVVLRGYDRHQVDEHVARLNRTVAKLRADLEEARQLAQAVPAAATDRPGQRRTGPPVPGSPGLVPPGPPGLAPAAPGPMAPGQGAMVPTGPPDPARPSPRPRPGVPADPTPDVVAEFSDRMQTILTTAKQEAEAQFAADGGEAGAEDIARAQLADLMRRRDAVLGELARARAMLEGLLGSPVTHMPPPLPGSGLRPAAAAPRTVPGPRPGSGSTAPDAAAAEAGHTPVADADVPVASADAPSDAAGEPAGNDPAEQRPDGTEGDPGADSSRSANGSPAPSGNRWPSLPN